MDRIQGMDDGADLYLVKPVDMDELAAAIKTVARRIGTLAHLAQAWRLDAISMQLLSPSGEHIELTMPEAALLRALAQSSDHFGERDALVLAMGKDPDAYDPRALEVAISRLRLKLGDDPPLKAVRARGYPTSGGLSSIALSADGSKLVASDWSLNNWVWTTSDAGTNWSHTDTPGVSSVAMSSDGSKMVIARGAPTGFIDFIGTSTDSGVTWTARDTGRNWTSVASSSDGTVLAATVGGTSGGIYTSTDSGLSWTLRASGLDLRSVAMSSDGSKIVTAAYGGKIYTWSGSVTATTAISGGFGSSATLYYTGSDTFVVVGATSTLFDH